MHVLLLSPYPEPLTGVLANAGDTWSSTAERITAADLVQEGYDLAVAYGYRCLLPADVVAARPIVNLHISLLPWNRGADPNLWSWAEKTPAGVTIHAMDSGIDTGPIIAQRPVPMDPTETLRSSYAKLQAAIQALFEETWPALRRGEVTPQPQPPGGTHHDLRDGAALKAALPAGYNTPGPEVARIWHRLRDRHNGKEVRHEDR